MSAPTNTQKMARYATGRSVSLARLFGRQAQQAWEMEKRANAAGNRYNRVSDGLDNKVGHHKKVLRQLEGLYIQVEAKARMYQIRLRELRGYMQRVRRALFRWLGYKRQLNRREYQMNKEEASRARNRALREGMMELKAMEAKSSSLAA